MKKMSTLFKRIFNEDHTVTTLNDVTPGCEWVFKGEGVATRKYDGACCAIIDGVFYKRYDAKQGKPIPDGAIKCQAEGDAVTGHLPCWVKVTDKPEDKWFRAAFKWTMCDEYDEMSELHKDNYERTYEAVGPHFNSNTDGFETDKLVRHGDTEIIAFTGTILAEYGYDLILSFEGIKEYLRKHMIEGIVFHHPDGRMCKIKRSDFGFEWNKKVR